MNKTTTNPNLGEMPDLEGLKPNERPAPYAPRRRRVLFILAGVVLGGLVVAAILAILSLLAFDDAGVEDAGAVVAGLPLELSLGDGAAAASCMIFDPAILADMSPAFAGTATAVDGETVTLAVDRWYAGPEAQTVLLHAQPGMQALIAGFDFEVGQQYLITAAQGNVNFCGYSGPATPELTAAFDQAFGR